MHVRYSPLHDPHIGVGILHVTDNLLRFACVDRFE